MVTVRVKGGTPRDAGTLCRTCRFGHIIKGFSASEEQVFCQRFYFERRISIAVFECSMYEDKRQDSRRDMEEIAWFLTTRKSGRSVGFVSAAKFRELQLDESSPAGISEETDKATE